MKKMDYILLFTIFLFIFLVEGKMKKGYKSDMKNDDKSVVSLSSGVAVSFSQGPAASTLMKWAREIEKSGGAVSHLDAVSREQQVVAMVNNGQWNINAYHEYQRLVAGTGNVDSARLLMEYGAAASIYETSLSQNKDLATLFQAITSCNYKKYKRLIKEDDMLLAMTSDDGTNALMVAALSNCVEVARHILQGIDHYGDAFDVDAIAANGLTALMIASSAGHNGIVSLLLSLGNATVNYPHKFAETTALHMAAEMGRASTISMLCLHGANSNLTTTTGGTPLHIAANTFKGNVDDASKIVAALVDDCNSSINSLLNNDTTPLYLAAQDGHAGMVEALILHGANPSFAMPVTSYKGTHQLMQQNQNKEGLSYYDIAGINTEAGNGAEALHAACEEGHANVVEVFIKYRKQQETINLNTLSMRVSPLHSAVQYNHPHVVRMLLEAGVDVDIHSLTDGATPLYWAVGRGYNEVIDILIAHGANVTKRQIGGGGFPLLYSVIKGQYQATKQLLAANAYIDDRTRTGLTPLYVAASQGHCEILELFLSDNYEGNYIASRIEALEDMSVDGDTLLHTLARHGYDKCGQIFLMSLVRVASKHYNRVDALIHRISNRDGSLAIHLAAQTGSSSLLELLIQSKADVHSAWNYHDNHKNPSLLTPGERIYPLFLAVRNGHIEAVEILLSHGADIEAESIIAVSSNRQQGGQTNDKTMMTLRSMTALLVAIDKGDVMISTLLLKQQADPNHGIVGPTAGIMQSPLLLAVVRGQIEIAKLLLDHGSICSVVIASKNQQGVLVQESLYEYAQRRRDYDMTQLLASYQSCLDTSKQKNQDL